MIRQALYEKTLILPKTSLALEAYYNLHVRVCEALDDQDVEPSEDSV